MNIKYILPQTPLVLLYLKKNTSCQKSISVFQILNLPAMEHILIKYIIMSNLALFLDIIDIIYDIITINNSLII